jgi:hypothetical protein
MVDPRLKLAFMQLVLARSISIEQAAARYGRHERAIRRWCWVAPISVRVAGGSRRVSIPLADLYAAGERKALLDFPDGRVSEIVGDAFAAYGMTDALERYRKVAIVDHRGNPDLSVVSER